MEVWGNEAFMNKDAETLYEQMALSISAYEQSQEVNPYTSKYDYFLAEEVDLSPEEAFGLVLFEGKALCSECHISQPGPDKPPLFTDFTYDNLGVPKNPDNPWYDMPKKWNPDGEDWVDYGLGGFLKSAGEPEEIYESELGKFKVPTLRNVDKRPDSDFVKAYGHNGYFKTLEEIVHFYNTRDVEEWPDPEYGPTVNIEELGDLDLNADEEAAIVAFMKTLTDGYILP
jgi:cytochrome c peroxidase